MSALRVSADKEVRREARTLTRLGFTLSHRSHGGKGHPVYTHPDWGRIQLASTPSDRNWVHAHRRRLAGLLGVTVPELRARLAQKRGTV